MRIRSVLVLSVLLLTACGGVSQAAAERRVALVFSGGHATAPVDKGRPVVLVAAGLGVPTTVFRTAFSGVRPAALGTQPEGSQVTTNKAALLRVLSPYGVTNGELDRVSDYYRYDGSAGQLWPVQPARGYAVIRAGRVVRVVVTAGGSGYTTSPVVTVPGVVTRATATVAFGRDLSRNGRVTAVAVA